MSLAIPAGACGTTAARGRNRVDVVNDDNGRLYYGCELLAFRSFRVTGMELVEYTNAVCLP